MSHSKRLPLPIAVQVALVHSQTLAERERMRGENITRRRQRSEPERGPAMITISAGKMFQSTFKKEQFKMMGE